ncbi:bifunctional diguanylate cyclase/phosphodiesterase [Brevibacillus daliensis]|uniref:bifunctional diguanylate cyclase/phosphodiesterase n=1 Tax=Brevibacillus daliensis TaxID=2892995 RepID=UPI001E4B5099|nr:diguanylate cyclase [Brevibacillus daliensis]
MYLQGHYNYWIVLLSFIIAILTSYSALNLTTKISRAQGRTKIGWPFSVAFVIGSFVGMLVLHMDMQVSYNVAILSMVASVISSYIALLIAMPQNINRWKFAIGGFFMGSGIVTMHYTGMKAALFWYGSSPVNQDGSDEINWFLLIGVLLAMLFILIISWVAMFFDRHILEKLAYSDSLTGLPNRHEMNRYFEEHTENLSGTALLLIDLDQFKKINDTLGHDVGDLLVQQVGERLQTFLGEKRQVFRIGGDEYLVIMGDCESTLAEQLAEDVLNAITLPYHIQENELHITASIGISLYPQHGKDQSTLLKSADTAMYNAKNAGKNQYCFYNEEKDKYLNRGMELEKGLRKAMTHQEFFVVYQPKWNEQTNRPVGLKALLRWNHSKLGLVSPVEFIPSVEETGLIVSMTRWILEEACSQNKRWIQEGVLHLPISVNLSARVFQSHCLVEMVQKVLHDTGLPPELLEIEITESMVFYDLEDIMRQLKLLRHLGVRLSMDDFRAGYSSLVSDNLTY